MTPSRVLKACESLGPVGPRLPPAALLRLPPLILTFAPLLVLSTLVPLQGRGVPGVVNAPGGGVPSDSAPVDVCDQVAIVFLDHASFHLQCRRDLTRFDGELARNQRDFLGLFESCKAADTA